MNEILPPGLRRPAAAFAVAALAFLVYGASLRSEFVCDDYPAIVDNPTIKSLSNVPRLFTAGSWDNLGLELDTQDQLMYRPFQLTSWAIVYAIWGLNPFGFHLLNVALHALNSALVFLALCKLASKDSLLPPLLAAAVFAVHPIHVEPVNWVASIHDLLLTFFCMLAFLTYVRHAASGRVWLLAVSFVFYISALLSKEVAVVFPALLITYDFVNEKRLRPYNFGGFVILAAAYLVLRRLILGATLGNLGVTGGGIGRAVEFIGGYVKWLILPWPQHFYFVTPDGGVIGAGAMLVAWAALIILAVYSLKKRDVTLLGLVWFAATLSPALSLALLPEPVFAARYLYLPSVALSIVLLRPLGFGLKNYPRLTAAICGAVLVLFTSGVLAGNRYWQHDGTFYSKAIEDNPEYTGGHEGLAKYLLREGRDEEAIDSYLKAALYGSAEAKVSAYINVAGIYGRRGISEKSIEYCRKSLEIDPENSKALNGLGNNYLMLKDYPKALQHYEKALTFDPSNAEACYNLAMTYDRVGNTAKADHYYRRFLEVAPEEQFAGAISKVTALLHGRGRL